jgi:outer membrane protein OmpA-like peptidoglycan-associated protein
MTGYQITFDNNSVEITRGVARLLTELSFEFEECGRVMVEIRGHTDARGDADRNLVLSGRRADAVKAFLSRIGVGDIEMKSEGFGESRPIASNNGETGRARNRRIEFAVSPVDPIAGMSHSSGDQTTESE